MPKAEPQPVHSLILGDYSVLEPALLSEVEILKKDDPLRPLIVLVPSHLLGLHLSRYLADSDMPHINIRFLTLEDLAVHVASPALLKAGRTGASQLFCVQILAEITAKLAQRDPEFYFSAISDRMGFHEAMFSALQDLKRACLMPEDLPSLLEKQRVKKAANIHKLKNVQEIWQTYETRMEELSWHDGCDVLRMACREAPGSKLLSESSALLIYGFYDFGALQKRFVASCAEANNTIAFVPFAPERAFDYVRPFITWLKSQGLEEKTPVQAGTDARPGSIRMMCGRLFGPGGPVKNIEADLAIISAPGEVREVREVIRCVSHEAVDQNVALHDTAILLRHSHPYTSMFRGDFRSLGLDPYMLEGPELSETRAGRSLCLLVDVLRHDFARRAVMEFATFARLDLKRFYGTGESVKPVTLWDLITMDAGIVEGKDEWDSHLGELLKQQEGPEAEAKPYTNDAIRALVRFSNHLIRTLTSIREAATWSEMINRLLSGYTSLVEPDEQTPDVTRAVSQLSRLNETEIQPSQAGLLDLIDEVLSETLEAQGRFQRNGPGILSLIAARGIPFGTIIIPGMVEKSFPSPARQNAILLDAERKTLNLEISADETLPIELRAEQRLDLERLFFRLAVGAAQKRLVLTFPRLAIGTARERVPSSFILAAIEAATGKRVDFDTAETFPAFRRIPLSRIGADEPREALDQAEFDIAVVSRDISANSPDGISYLSKTSDFFAGAMDLETSRWGKITFTPYDGVLTKRQSRGHLSSEYSILNRSVAPTRLETYATCPYKYYLEEVLRVRPIIEPEHVESIDPMDRGSLIHSILWEFFTVLKKRQASHVPVVVSANDRDLLHATATRAFDRFEKMGLTGYPMMWEIERQDITARLEELFAEELEQSEYFPAYFEVRYGMKSRGEAESAASIDEAVRISLGKIKINLRGKIDRIDLTRDCRRARIVDYKTGKSRPRYKDNSLHSGESLQLPLYLYAAHDVMRRFHEDIRVDYAEYYHTAVAGGKRHIRFDYDELKSQENDLAFIVGTIAEGIAAGLFFAYPEGDTCRYCDFSLICGTAKEYIYERKSSDRRIGAFLRMKGKAPDREEAD